MSSMGNRDVHVFSACGDAAKHNRLAGQGVVREFRLSDSLALRLSGHRRLVATSVFGLLLAG
ncbi:MAG: hypothetical protein ABIL25_00765 [candidate division WOR-3 bacterium]